MRVAVLGTGLMGAPLAMRLLEADHEVWVWNRDPERAEPLRAGGAEVAATPVEAIAEAEFVITMLSDARAIVEVAFSEQARGVLRDRTLIQMATIDPQESRELAAAMQEAGGDYLEAPVLGSIPEATRGELIIMAGGEEAVFQRCLPLLRSFGPEPRLIGAVGKGAALKLAMNQLIAGLTASFSLSLALVRHEGVSVDDFMTLLRGSALYAPTFDKKLPRMLEGDFDRPNFPLKHLDKDTKLFIRAAERHALALSGIKGVEQLLERGLLEGLANQDYSALYTVIDRSPPQPEAPGADAADTD